MKNIENVEDKNTSCSAILPIELKIEMNIKI